MERESNPPLANDIIVLVYLSPYLVVDFDARIGCLGTALKSSTMEPEFWVPENVLMYRKRVVTLACLLLTPNLNVSTGNVAGLFQPRMLVAKPETFCIWTVFRNLHV